MGAQILYRVCHLDVGSSCPPGVGARKGGAVLPIKWYASWVQSVVRQDVLYLLG